MKKFLGAVCALMVCFAFTGCPRPDATPPVLQNPETPVEPVEELSLDDVVNGSAKIVDLTGTTITENVELRSAKIIKNADFGGNTLIVKASGTKLYNVKNCNLVIDEEVGDGEVIADSCNFNNVTVNGGGANSIHFKNTRVVTIDVKKDDVRIVLEEKTSVSDSVNVQSNGTKIEVNVKASDEVDSSEKATPVIKAICIGSTVNSITLDGGSIQQIKVETSNAVESTPVITIASAATNIEAVVLVGDNEVEVDEGYVNVVIAPEVREEKVDYVVNSDKVRYVTITDVNFDLSGMKTEYFKNEKFVGSGVKAVVLYSNETKAEFEIEKKYVELLTEGFSSEVTDSIKLNLSISYAGHTRKASLVVKVKPTTATVEEAIALLQDMNYDDAIQMLKNAYEENPCNETALYYALASIASVSTDESVESILKENFGFKEYPATMNALFSTEWMKAYNKYYYGDLYTIGEYDSENPYYQDIYIKCEGFELSKVSNGYLSVSVIEPVKSLGETVYISSYYYNGHFNPSEDGQYYVRYYDLIYELGYSEEELEDCPIYYISRQPNNYENKRIILDEDTVHLPGIVVPEWFKETDAYSESVFGTMQSTTYFGYSLFAALINCNPNGFNNLIDKVTTVFETKFDDAVNAINSMDDNTIVVPEMLVSMLNLQEVFGEGDIYIGKAEANVIVAALELMKGMFEYLQANDFTVNFGNLKNSFDKITVGESTHYSIPVLSAETIDEWVDFIYDGMTSPLTLTDELLKGLNIKDVLGSRNNNAMTKAKESITNGLTKVIDSYEFLMSSDSYYPAQVREMISMYGNGIYVLVKELNKAITYGEKFPLPMALLKDPDFMFTNTAWNFADNEILFSIDFDEFFKAGAFGNLFGTDSAGNYIYSYSIRTSYSYSYTYDDENGNLIHSDTINNTVADLDIYNAGTVKSVLKDHATQVVDGIDAVSKNENYTNWSWSYYYNYTGCVPVIRVSVIEKVFPGLLKKMYPEGCIEGDYFLTASLGLNGINDINGSISSNTVVDLGKTEIID